MTGTRSSAFTFAVVAEARADQQIASELAERVVIERVDWIGQDHLKDFCRWQGLDASTGFLAWKSVAREARARGIKTHGKFRQFPGAFDERRARMALLLFKKSEDRPDGVLLVRDTDNEDARINSLEKVRAAGRWEFQVLMATPRPKRECWVLAGFDPVDSEEETVLGVARSDLGFDPRSHAERLTARGSRGKRNAKKVLEELTRKSSEREQGCWRQAPLSVLRERGQGSRLTAYLDEVERFLVPMLAGQQPRAEP